MSISSVLITGANRGIGLEFVKLLVKQNPAPKVIVATCRDPSKAEVLLTRVTILLSITLLCESILITIFSLSDFSGNRSYSRCQRLIRL